MLLLVRVTLRNSFNGSLCFTNFSSSVPWFYPCKCQSLFPIPCHHDAPGRCGKEPALTPPLTQQTGPSEGGH